MCLNLFTSVLVPALARPGRWEHHHTDHAVHRRARGECTRDADGLRTARTGPRPVPTLHTSPTAIPRYPACPTVRRGALGRERAEVSPRHAMPSPSKPIAGPGLRRGHGEAVMTVAVVTAVSGATWSIPSNSNASTGRIDAILQYSPQEHASGAVIAGGGGPPHHRGCSKKARFCSDRASSR